MRRNLLSCTSLARHGLSGLVTTLLLPFGPAAAADFAISEAISAWLDLNHQEFAVLTTALALLGFSVVAAILLMRTRLRAVRNELRLRVEIAGLQAQADRLRALLFAEPQVLASWAAGDDRPRISGDIALLVPADSPQRILAFGTWLPPEPALQMDHAVDSLRESGEGFLLNLTTSTGRAIEAMGRAIGGQAIVRIRELGGLRRELAESNLRFKALQEETELLRDFAAAAPWPIWAKGAKGDLRYANPAYVSVTEAKSAADAVSRNLELLETDQRGELSRALSDNASYAARLPIVVGGERRTYDVHALKLGGGSAGIAIDASEATELRAPVAAEHSDRFREIVQRFPLHPDQAIEATGQIEAFGDVVEQIGDAALEVRRGDDGDGAAIGQEPSVALRFDRAIGLVQFCFPGAEIRLFRQLAGGAQPVEHARIIRVGVEEGLIEAPQPPVGIIVEGEPPLRVEHGNAG